MTAYTAAKREAGVRCQICGHSRGREHQAREMMLGTRDEFTYWECADCGCLALVTIPLDFGKYYPSDGYYSMSERKPSFARRFRDKVYLSSASWLVNWRPRTDLDVIRRAGLTKKMSFLDVGCGAGTLLADLRELGYLSATGVDPYISSDVYDRHGLRVKRQKLADVRGAFDVILFRHSLEHMPVDSLAMAAPLLKPRGVCVVCIPVVGWAWEHYKTNWVQLDAPRHLFLHTRKSFELLAAKGGFRIHQAVYDSRDFQFWGSEAYSQDIPLNKAPHPRGLELLKLRYRASRLNREALGDSAQFYLQRTEFQVPAPLPIPSAACKAE